jgi:acylphosphatase
MTDDVLRLLRIHGRVQGVGYRAFVRDQATQLGLAGWVRNRSDGSVEALVAGQAAAVERLIALLRKGPPGGRVTRIDETDAAARAELRANEARFIVLPTL